MESRYEYIPGVGVRDRALPSSVADWEYETDLTLSHSSGLSVYFPQRSAGLARVKCLGYFLDDIASERQAPDTGRGESVLSTPGLLSEAEALFHSLPAGTPGAPRSIKRDRLLSLVEHRRASRWDGYRQVGEFHDGAYESDHISPVTKSAGCVDARVFILFRDWSKEKTLSGTLDRGARDFGCTRGERKTNDNLKILLRRNLGCELSQTYATALFPFIRREGIPFADLERAAIEFAIPQIEIVAPRFVICLGLETFNVLRRISGLNPVNDLAEGLEQSFRFANADVWIQAHPGFYGTTFRRYGNDESWALMAKAFHRA